MEDDHDTPTRSSRRILISKWRLADPIAQELVGRSYAIEMPLEAKVLLWRPSSEFEMVSRHSFRRGFIPDAIPIPPSQ